jgi:hypothetical protein
LQGPSEANENNLSDVRREASRHFRNKKREYLKDRINELESNSKNKNIRDLYMGTNECKKGYHPRTMLVKDKRGNLLVDPHKILNRCKNYFCQLLNLLGWVVLDRLKCIQLSHLCQSPMTQRLRFLLASWKVINLQMLIKLQLN